MSLILSLQAATGTGHTAKTSMTLVVALLFAAIYLFGGRADQVFRESAVRRFHSFSSGCAISYVFIYIMPELHVIRAAHLQAKSDYLQRVFPEFSVYLSALLGFLAFYSLESMVSKPRQEAGKVGKLISVEGALQPWLHIGSFAFYTWLITFQMGHSGKGVIALCVFALAMGLHIATTANRLRSEHSDVYEHRGAVVLALASLAGWVCGVTWHPPDLLMLDMTAIVAGGVIVNAALDELPSARKASIWSFLSGAVFYSALLLTLSYLEHGTH